MVFDDNDLESKIVRYIFSSLSFEYSGMSGSPTGYKYDKAKDSIKWQGLSPRDYIPLLDNMFHEFKKMIKKPT